MGCKFQSYLVSAFRVVEIDIKNSKQSICTVHIWQNFYRHLIIMSRVQCDTKLGLVIVISTLQ